MKIIVMMVATLMIVSFYSQNEANAASKKKKQAEVTPSVKKEKTEPVKQIDPEQQIDSLSKEISSKASAASVYLNCEIATVSSAGHGVELDKAIGSKNQFSVKLDEASGKITHTAEGQTLTNSNQFNTEGFFTASSISYQNILNIDHETSLTEIYRIDRSDLTVKMNGMLFMLGQKLNILSKDGTCTIEKAKKNKI